MKASIPVAGRPGRTFPEGSKPKCLFHYKGRVILEYIVDALLEAGVSDIRLITGYQDQTIREYVGTKGWNVEIVRNDAWATDAVRSVELGLQGSKTSVLIVSGDLVIDAAIIRGFLQTDPQRPAWIRSLVPWGVSTPEYQYDEIYRPDIDNSIIKIPYEMLNILDRARENADRFIARYHWLAHSHPGSGVYYGAAVTETLYRSGPVDEVVIAQALVDIDYISQTDEWVIANGIGRLMAVGKDSAR